MKRLLAIALLSVHLFNLGGYVLLFQYFIHKSEVEIVKQIFDNKVDESKYIVIKIPTHMPTIQDWNDYEVVEGQIQLKDAYYNYVKLKMTRDTLYFVCTPNAVKTHLVKSTTIVANMVSDVPVNKKGQESAVKRIVVNSEYEDYAFQYHYTDFAKPVKSQQCIFISSKITDPFIESPGKPPNFIS